MKEYTLHSPLSTTECLINKSFVCTKTVHRTKVSVKPVRKNGFWDFGKEDQSVPKLFEDWVVISMELDTHMHANCTK